MDFGTHDYVGSLPCGCGVAICRDMPEYVNDTADSVAGMIKEGLTVQRLEHDSACEVFATQCAEFPHTDWQKRNEQARLDRQQTALPL